MRFKRKVSGEEHDKTTSQITQPSQTSRGTRTSSRLRGIPVPAPVITENTSGVISPSSKSKRALKTSRKDILEQDPVIPDDKNPKVFGSIDRNEEIALSNNSRYIIGVDEAGRGIY